MRPEQDMPRRRPRTQRRGRVVLIVSAVVLFILITFLRQIAEFWTDYLWFDSVDFSKVWTRSVTFKLELGVVFTLVFFLALWINLLIADRVSPRFHPVGPDDELLNRYHQVVDRRAGLLRFVVAAVFAFITGAGMSSLWNEWALFSHGGDFGTVDPQFGLDIGFYVFRLPFLVSLVDWLFAALIIILLITAVAHYLNGGIRFQAPFERVTPQVKVHLSVLLALLALVKACDYWLQRYTIMFSDRGTVNGASYTEVNAVLPALYLLLFIAVASVVLFLVNIRRRGWVLPIVAVGLWALVQVVVGEAYPAIYQAAIVRPEESTKETSAITNNIAATRKAYGLDKIEETDFQGDSSVDAAAKAIDENPATIKNVQLLDTRRVGDTFQKQQSVEAPLRFGDVATDRYLMRTGPDGALAPTQVVIANREMDARNMPSQSWENIHLNYTHGYGLALAAGGRVAPGGSPDYSVKNIPLQSTDQIDLSVVQPNNYFFDADASNPTAQLYSLVDTGAPEFDYVHQAADPSQSYKGRGGVPLDSFGRRMAFFVKYGDPYLLISQYITDQSRILYLRGVRQRVQTAAPFLTYDADPYPIVADGRVYYVIDAYTTSNFYPNSQRYKEDPNAAETDLRGTSFNYVRNSVKAVVDAYDGTMKFYVIDAKDPVVAAYQQAFPELFTNIGEMSQDVRRHLRYPEDIFRVQTEMYGRYHLQDPANFYKFDSAWEIPAAPPDRVLPAGSSQQAQSALPNSPFVIPQTTARSAPYYVMNKLPGDLDTNFMLMRSFQPFSPDNSKQNLTAFMVARCDGEDLGRLQVYRTPNDDQNGPGLVSSKILNDPAVQTAITQLNQQGSLVTFSDLILVPLDHSIVYVRSMYVQSTQGDQQPPAMRYVVLYFNGNVYVKVTLREALKAAFPNSNPKTLELTPDGTGVFNNGGVNVVPPDNPTTTTSTTATPGTTIPGGGGDAAQLYRQASQALADADQARLAGNLGLFQQKVAEARQALDQAQALESGTPVTTSSTSTTTSSTAAPPPESSPDPSTTTSSAAPVP